MPRSLHAWYGLGDLAALCERQATLSGEIELNRLKRLRPLLHTEGGSVRARLAFRQRRTGYLVVDLQYETTVELLCQRCLEPMSYPIIEQVRIALLESASMEPHVEQGAEPVLLEEGRLMPSALIEDELIVSLPLVPRHARIEECGHLARRLQTLEEEEGDEAHGDRRSQRH